MLKINSCDQSEFLPALGGIKCANKMMVGFNLIRRDVRIDLSTFDKDALDKLIETGKWIGYLEPFQKENANQDAQYATSVQGQRSQKVKAIKGWTFTFDEGNCFNNEMEKLNNSRLWSFAPVLEDGSIILNQFSDGKAGGFESNLFTGVFDLPLTADVSGSQLMVDLTPKGSRDWATNSILVSALDFQFDEITPIKGIRMVLPTVITGVATSVAVNVSELCASTVDNFATSSAFTFEVKNNAGVVTYNAPSAVVQNGNVLTFTVTAFGAGKTVKLVTKNSTSNTYGVAKNNEFYYYGESNSVITT